MRQDPVQRLQRINEAMVNLIERSRAAEREAQRAANRQPVRTTDGGGLDRGAARASQNTGTTMVTGRDGKLYQQGADPTRAQPGSALYNQMQAQKQQAQPSRTIPSAPVAPAPRTAPAAPAAPKAQGNIKLPAAAATALGQGDPAMKAYVGQLDQGDPWRGQTKKPEAKPAAPAAPASPSYSGMGSLNYDPAQTPPTVAPAAPKSGGFNPGSLMMTGSTPPTITAPATTAAAAKPGPSMSKAPRQDFANLNPLVKAGSDAVDTYNYGSVDAAKTARENEANRAKGFRPLPNRAGTVEDSENQVRVLPDAVNSRLRPGDPNFDQAERNRQAARDLAAGRQPRSPQNSTIEVGTGNEASPFGYNFGVGQYSSGSRIPAPGNDRGTGRAGIAPPINASGKYATTPSGFSTRNTGNIGVDTATARKAEDNRDAYRDAQLGFNPRARTTEMGGDKPKLSWLERLFY